MVYIRELSVETFNEQNRPLQAAWSNSALKWMVFMEGNCPICESDISSLTSTRQPSVEPSRPKLRIADLFSGCGGLSLGLRNAAHHLGYSIDVRLALDSDEEAMTVYSSSFPDATTVCKNIEQVIDGELDSPPTDNESNLVNDVGRLDILLGGPPCQGHSNLNNHSRRDDPRNRLYLSMARAAELLKPSIIIVENVPTVTFDVRKSVQKTVKNLKKLGYTTGQGVIDLRNLGVPQKRRRHVVVAVSDVVVDVQATIEELKEPKCEHLPRSVRWAIGDLQDVKRSKMFDSPSRPSETNQSRIDWLFANDEFNLPNRLRPPCHQSQHTYTAMYGRLEWDKPAPTVTTGFNSTGQGRYVHPSQRRVVTPHEAARLQMLPDFVDFGLVRTRKQLAKLIGNSAPPPLTSELGKKLIPHMKGMSDSHRKSEMPED